jgi:hypothetical protein
VVAPEVVVVASVTLVVEPGSVEDVSPGTWLSDVVGPAVVVVVLFVFEHEARTTNDRTTTTPRTRTSVNLSLFRTSPLHLLTPVQRILSGDAAARFPGQNYLQIDPHFIVLFQQRRILQRGGGICQGEEKPCPSRTSRRAGLWSAFPGKPASDELLTPARGVGGQRGDLSIAEFAREAGHAAADTALDGPGDLGG